MDSFIEDDFPVHLHCDVCKKERDPLQCIYYCAACHFMVEVNYIISEVILHLFHQLHHLELLYKKPSNSKELCNCVACGFNIDEAIRYECRKCEFCLHLECGSLMVNIKFHGHEHLLALIDINMCSQRTKWECNACEWEIEDDPILRCVECKYNSYISCLAVSPPETTMYKHHQHSLTLRPDHKTLVRDQNASYYCDACNKKRILKHPFYSSTECDYNTH
ncbi:hypothetical protein CISIN_1g043545mg, partial [Citrus sinensis]